MIAVAAVIAIQLSVAQALTGPAPPWVEVFQRIHGSQGGGAKLDAFDVEVERAWADALQAGPHNPYFLQAAQNVAGFYQSKGFELKARDIWQKAITVSEGTSLTLVLRQRLAGEYQNSGRLVKAAETLRQLVPTIQDSATRAEGLSQVAFLEDQMGEVEAAEQHYREAAAIQSEAPTAPAGVASRWFHSDGSSATVLGSGIRAGRSTRGPAELASFYERNGRAAEAETVLEESIAEAKRRNDIFAVQIAMQYYTNLLYNHGRGNEAVALASTLVAELDASDASLQNRSNARQNLAQLLSNTGRNKHAVEILRENTRMAAQGSVEQQFHAFLSLARMQMNLRDLEDAEKSIATARQRIAPEPPEQRQFLELSAKGALSQLRAMQNRHEESNQLRRSIAGPPPYGDITPLWLLIEPAQQALARRDYDRGMELVSQLLPAARERAASNPSELGGVAQLVNYFPPEREKDRELLLTSLLSILDNVTPPDRPQLVEAYLQIVTPLTSAGMLAEGHRILQRMERIIMAARGEDSPVLNQVSRHRIRMIQAGSVPDAAAEARKMVARSEAAAGPRSQMALSDLREVASLYETHGKFADEERIRLLILQRSEKQSPQTQVSALLALGRVYFNLGQREQALGFMDRAVSLARSSPQTTLLVPSLEQESEKIQTSRLPKDVNSPVRRN